MRVGLGDCFLDEANQIPCPDINVSDPIGNNGANCLYGIAAAGNCLPAPGGGGGFTGSGIPVTSPVTSSSSWLQQLLGGVASNIGKVYSTRNAVPQLQPGESITQLANGTYQITQQPAGVPATGGSLSLSSGLSTSGSLPLLIGGAVVVFLLMKGGR